MNIKLNCDKPIDIYRMGKQSKENSPECYRLITGSDDCLSTLTLTSKKGKVKLTTKATATTINCLWLLTFSLGFFVCENLLEIQNKLNEIYNLIANIQMRFLKMNV